uniref:Alcohol dehydrogenase 1 n=1 Tax=Takifugu rubripes TaxID=31033 RepID=A0A674NSI2_TAKRU
MKSNNDNSVTTLVHIHCQQFKEWTTRPCPTEGSHTLYKWQVKLHSSFFSSTLVDSILVFCYFPARMTTAGKIIKCRAAVAWEPNKPVVIEEIEVAPPQSNEIRIKIVATGVCHTDLYHLFEGMHKDGFPAVLGHEGAGIVESIGPGVTEFQPGDKVIPLFISQCRQCRFCKSPKTNQCEKGWAADKYDVMAPEESRFTCRGKKVLQFMGTSTFSEYTVMNQVAVAKIDPAAPLDKVCLLGCGICTGYGAAVNTAKVEPGSTCAVFGLGAVGLAAVMGCNAAGAKRIIAVDINPEKFEKAKVFGATDFVNPKDHDKPISQVLSEMTNGGVDFSLECTGNVEVMRSAFESCVQGWGISVIVGWTDLADVATRPVQLIGGRTWKGSAFGGFKGRDGVPLMVERYLEKKLMLDEFITHETTLDQINDAIELMKHGKCIRTVLKVASE